MRALISIILFLPLAAFSQFETAAYFSANMMLQRDQPIPVWGRAIPGRKVEVRFGTHTKQTVARTDSSWLLYLPPQPASYEPGTLQISSGDTAVLFPNILTGDIWLCLGQSNMEWPMNLEMHFKEAVKKNQPRGLRIYNPVYAGKNIYTTVFPDSVSRLLTTNRFYQGAWQTCDSQTLSSMSAVAYYFGHTISTNMHIPVGLINLAIGGAPLETFIDQQILLTSKQFNAKVSGDWLKNNSLPVWIRERGMQNIGNVNTVAADAYGKNHGFKPGFAYAAGIQSLRPMPIKGILLYQGESNAQETERVMEYGALTALMVSDYRKKWKNPALPFYFVQLSSIDSIRYKSQLWPLFRDEQRKLLQRIPNSGMAVCSDIGSENDVHPRNKKEVGERLARLALYSTYRQKIIPSGPLPQKAIYKNGKITIRFSNSGNALLTADGKPVRGFSVDGKNDCPAFIEKNQITIPVETRPLYVYYGWQPFTTANLINTENLPASTFKINVQ